MAAARRRFQVITKSICRTGAIAALWLAATLTTVPHEVTFAQQGVGTQPEPVQFGGSYSALDARRQHLVDDFVARFGAVTNTKPAPGPFYDEQIAMSSKTTFDAITYALARTTLTDASGQRLGDALDLIEHVESIHGQIDHASGDHQFRMYAVLKERTLDLLNRAQEFKREGDNTVYHHGYPINYRQNGGAPSIQISLARDGRRADIDVDYRSSSFPAALFNGHLTAANSDVRAGNNYDRFTGRWSGFQNWWRTFFGVGVSGSPDNTPDQRSQILPEDATHRRSGDGSHDAGLPQGLADRRQRSRGHGLRFAARVRLSG